MRRPALFLLPLLATMGCASKLNLPRASFHGMTIQTVQPDDDRLELEVGVDFKVDNPLGFRLTVPEHTFGLAIDGAPATSTGVHRAFEVKAKKQEVVTYALRLDPVALGKALGRDATFQFQADVDLDVADALQRTMGDILRGAGEAGAQLAGASEDAVAAAGETAESASTVTLSFEHTGRLKIPKVPRVRRAQDAAGPAVSLVGESAVLNLDDALADLKASGGPVVQLLAQILGQRPQQDLTLPVGDLLEAAGVPSNLVSGALQALNTFLVLQGESRVRSRGTQVTVPVQMPRLDQLVATLDPAAAEKIDAFTASWEGFSNGTLAGAEGLQIPTALPSGLRVMAPFAIHNPNEFAVHTPTFRLGLVDGDGQPLLLIGALPTAEADTTDLSVRRVSPMQAEGQTDTPMSLVSEVHWDQLTGGLLQAAVEGGPVKLPAGVRLVGEVTIDPGYGPITVPLNIALQPTPDAEE